MSLLTGVPVNVAIIRVKGKELPMTAILGLVATLAIWIIIVITQPYSRWVGIGWMVIGLVIYSIYRLKERIPIIHLKKEPDQDKPL